MDWKDLFEKLPDDEKAHIFTEEAERQRTLKNFDVASQFRKLAEEAKHADNDR